jgi:hypothetical protein
MGKDSTWNSFKNPAKWLKISSESLVYFVVFFLFPLGLLSSVFLMVLGRYRQENQDFRNELSPGFVRTKDLDVGETIYIKGENGELSPVKIESIKKTFGDFKVYNLTVKEGNPTYFADDFAVHNKGSDDRRVFIRDTHLSGEKVWYGGVGGTGCSPQPGTNKAGWSVYLLNGLKVNGGLQSGCNSDNTVPRFSNNLSSPVSLSVPPGWECTGWTNYDAGASGSECQNVPIGSDQGLYFDIRKVVRGRITMADSGDPVSGAVVRVYNDQGNSVPVTTGNNGYFRSVGFINRFASVYAVRVEAIPSVPGASWLTSANGWSWNHLKNPNVGTLPWADEAPGYPSYEGQRLEVTDCSGPDSSGVAGRCNFEVNGQPPVCVPSNLGTGEVFCSEETFGLVETTNSTYIDTCINADQNSIKCEYSCDDNYVRVNGECVPASGICIDLPQNAEFCSEEEETQLTVDEPARYAPECDGAFNNGIKCEFDCSQGYVWEASLQQCVPAQCSPVPPEAGGEYCPNETIGLSENAQAVHIAACGVQNPAVKCEYVCREGYFWYQNVPQGVSECRECWDDSGAPPFALNQMEAGQVFNVEEDIQISWKLNFDRVGFDDAFDFVVQLKPTNSSIWQNIGAYDSSSACVNMTGLSASTNTAPYVGSSGGYSIYSCAFDSGVLNVGQEYDVRVSVLPASQGGICPARSASSSVIVSVPAWFQVQSGNVHTNDQDLSNNLDLAIYTAIPLTCGTTFANCAPYFYADPAGSASGLLSYNTGALSVPDGSAFGVGRLVSRGTLNAREFRAGRHPVFSGSAFNFGYAYWRDKLSAVSQNWSPGQGPVDGYNKTTDATGLVQIGGGTWNGISGKKIVVLHDGDVNIVGDVVLGSDSALLVVASGEIRVNPAVRNLDGVFIAPSIVTESVTSGDDQQLKVYGSFIGYEEISLGRDLGSEQVVSQNAGSAAEVFRYNPGLVENLRSMEELNSFNYIFREVAP